MKKIKLKAPIILPAMVKLNWEDYYSGAAMAGVMVVIGENAINKDVNLKHDSNGKVVHAPFLGKVIDCFRRFEKGYGDIVLQVNADDIVVGTAEYALKNFELRSIEIKFGQAAKGIQHVAPVYSYDEAVSLKNKGYLVFLTQGKRVLKRHLIVEKGFILCNMVVCRCGMSLFLRN